jgi:hypothetical protein
LNAFTLEPSRPTIPTKKTNTSPAAARMPSQRWRKRVLSTVAPSKSAFSHPNQAARQAATAANPVAVNANGEASRRRRMMFINSTAAAAIARPIGKCTISG